MQKISHAALIHFSADVVSGPASARKILQDLQAEIQIAEISSVYKRFKDRGHADLNATMEFVVKVTTALAPESLLKFIDCFGSKVQGTLLVYDDLILMAPQLTLPYPELHNDSLVIHCAAEAWGRYEHPIYHKTLSEISKGLRVPSDTEFFLQGRYLLDI